jgi:hypothetical protein
MARSSPDRGPRGAKVDRSQQVQADRPALPPPAAAPPAAPAPPDKERSGWPVAIRFWVAGFLFLLLFELLSFLGKVVRQLF